MRSHFKIGTRGSALAMYQAILVESRFKKFYPMINFEIVKIKTKGDMIRRGGISSIGRGIFTREIEEALQKKEVDFAVHSAKDLETDLPEGLVIGAVLEREDSRDCLVSVGKRKFKDLSDRAKVGTSSLRRRAQLKRLRPDLEICELRGNVDTRIKKLQTGEYEGIVLAHAGLKRLGLAEMAGEVFDPAFFLPQAAQGSIAIEIRQDDSEAQKMTQTLNHEISFFATEAERSFLRRLHGGCQVPIGIRTNIQAKEIELEGAIFALDGSREIKSKKSGELQKANQIGIELANQILDAGGSEILDQIRKQIG